MSENQASVLEGSDAHHVKSEAQNNLNVAPNHVFGIQNALELPDPNARAYTALDLHSESRFCIVRMGC